MTSWPLTFSSSITVSSRILHAYKTEIKPKVNGEATFHSQKEPKGFTKIYGTETREEGDRSDWEEKSENQSRIQQSTQG